jgi:hypothetical protein
MSSYELRMRKAFIKLLKEDEEFRYMVAGLIGLEEILKRLDKNEQELIRLREDMVEGFKRHDEEIAKLREDMNKLREDMVAGFKRHDEEIAKLRKDMVEGFKRHDEEIAKLREDMVEGFKRHDLEIAKLREDMIMGFKRHDEELVKLREDMNRGFELVERHISALGARWGIMAEDAFRNSLKGLLEKSFKVSIERWRDFDGEGFVYEHPSLVEMDVAVQDQEIILIEVTSHARKSDVTLFKKKATFYEKKTGRKPSRLIIVTPYADEEALELSEKLQIELYTKV